jgi:hypothetical protein
VGENFHNKKNLRICAGRCKIISTKCVLKKLTYQYLWDPDCAVFWPRDASVKTQGNEPKCNQLLPFSLTVTAADSGATTADFEWRAGRREHRRGVRNSRERHTPWNTQNEKRPSAGADELRAKKNLRICAGWCN